MQLEDRYYTSTEVAEILGVSLRSVYRYMEDNKLIADVKTATGRHRFTKQNIIDFLYPDGKVSPLLMEEPRSRDEVVSVQKVKAPKISDENQNFQPMPIKQEVIEKEEPEVDWLAKFREAATKYKDDQVTAPVQQPQVQPVIEPQPAPVQPQYVQPQPVIEPQPAPVQPRPVATPTLMYYRSMLGGLKDIAQNLDKSARNSNLDYAFTLNAGASLHKPIKPFATLHAYAKSSDRDFFEKILRLTPANPASAQFCLVISDNASIYSQAEEIHGLYVVSKEQLKRDIATFGDVQLAQEMADVL